MKKLPLEVCATVGCRQWEREVNQLVTVTLQNALKMQINLFSDYSHILYIFIGGSSTYI